jgi:hypothetical protein
VQEMVNEALQHIPNDDGKFSPICILYSVPLLQFYNKVLIVGNFP